MTQESQETIAFNAEASRRTYSKSNNNKTYSSCSKPMIKLNPPYKRIFLCPSSSDDDEVDSHDEIIGTPEIQRQKKAAIEAKKRTPTMRPAKFYSSPATSSINISPITSCFRGLRPGSPEKITIPDSSDDELLKSQSDTPDKEKAKTTESTSDANKSSVHLEIDKQSHRCLQSGQMLNDTIIEFYMNHIMQTEPNANRDNFHLFNTFIYNKLKKLERNVYLGGDAEKSFAETVKSWDKNVKLFEKKYLVMPICDHVHWVLVVICFPDKVAPSDRPTTVNIQSTCSPPQHYLPCIIIFDSLGYKHMSKFTEPIRTFLHWRWRFERPNEGNRKFKDRGAFPDINARVPRQRNTYDCGIHLLVAFKKFFTQPKSLTSKIRAGEDLKPLFQGMDTRLERHQIRSLLPTHN